MTAGAIIQAASFGLPEFIVGQLSANNHLRVATAHASLRLTSLLPVSSLAGRIVTGFGNGFITASVPVWQSECAKAEHRGYLVMIEGALSTSSHSPALQHMSE